jgi:hypothetical protein
VRAVIGLVGHARHGKDAAAQILLRLLPGAERFAFSDALAVECRVHHGMTRRDPRLLQTVGMAWREARPGVWLDALYGAICDRQPGVAVITGVRFADEVDMVRAIGGTLLRVVRLDAAGRPFVSGDRDPNHAAEAEIDALAVDWSVAVPSGDLRGLEAAVRHFVACRGLAA